MLVDDAEDANEKDEGRRTNDPLSSSLLLLLLSAVALRSAWVRAVMVVSVFIKVVVVVVVLKPVAVAMVLEWVAVSVSISR